MIVIPVSFVGEIEYTNGVVPPIGVNAVAESARKTVVKMLLPPVIPSVPFTVMVMALVPIAPTPSVAVTVS